MSINVGNSFATAHIGLERMHKIRDKSSSPEMTLWEKIKEFFFSTHQREALDCIHKLYHHSSYQMSNREIKETFLKLRDLASPGHKDKFTMTNENFSYSYKVAGEEIVSVRYDDRFMHENKHNAFYNLQGSCDSIECDSSCEENERVFDDMQRDNNALDVEYLRMISHEQRNRIAPDKTPLCLGEQVQDNAFW